MSDASPVQAATLPGRRAQVGLMTEDSASGPSRFRNGQQTVFARLQSFFPSTSSQRPSVIVPPPPLEPKVNPATPTRPPPRYLKIRIVSWNMHDSLPKGNLEDLLGTVPPYVPCPENETDKLRIPDLTTEDGHPYHLVVVAGQECPTVSGIPMGLAAGLRPKEKDRSKDSDRGAKKKKGKENSKDDDLEADVSLMSNPPPTPGADMQTAASSRGATSGWSWILEEWYCNGLGHRQDGTVTSSASELYDSQAANSIASDEARTLLHPGSIAENNEPYKSEGGRKKKDGHKKRKGCRDGKHVGPYELLVKERLMGIYMAVFIYRDLKQLVRGVSKSSVTAGLMGGLVGNKGGVGISINLDGATLLFINAHLAAHEDRTMSRVANFNKIKTELQVNDFLSQDDPRVMSEDLTDKFDYTFLFGDLNFRLDITRLHADWLIARQDYDQALTFDQLRPLMRDGEAFMRYSEATIHFPPTFKYNVVKSAKRDKSTASKELGRARGSKRWLGHRSNQNLSEVQETVAELSARLANEERGGSLDAEDDNASFTSTTVTSMLSQGGNGEPGDSDALFPRPSSRLSNQSKGGVAITKDNSAARKLFVAKAALKAKTKWMAMVRPKKSNQPIGRKISNASQRSSFSASFPQLKTHAATSESTSPAFRAASSAIELGRASAQSTGELRRVSSKRSIKSTRSTKEVPSTKGTENSRQEADPGVYDTSSKQRVPSWCDRILWKSTVEPEPDSDSEEEPAVPDQRNGRLGPRMLALLTQALRPLTPRARAMSLSSLPTLQTAEADPPTSEKEALRPGTARSGSQPLVRHASAGSEKDSGLIKVKVLANIVSMRNFPNRKPRKAKLSKSRSIDPPSPTPVLASSRKRRSRAYSAVPQISAPVITPPDDTAYITEVNDPELSPPVLSSDNTARQRTPSTRGWLRLPFFNREPEVDRLAATLSYGSPQNQETPVLKPHRPRRGEVVPLSYRSLDDQAMQRLEGRSDHRPVIGSYIIYV